MWNHDQISVDFPINFVGTLIYLPFFFSLRGIYFWRPRAKKLLEKAVAYIFEFEKYKRSLTWKQTVSFARTNSKIRGEKKNPRKKGEFNTPDLTTRGSSLFWLEIFQCKIQLEVGSKCDIFLLIPRETLFPSSNLENWNAVGCLYFFDFTERPESPPTKYESWSNWFIKWSVACLYAHPFFKIF